MISCRHRLQRHDPAASAVPVCLLLVAFNLAVWGWAWVAFAGRPALLGTALLAYTLGLRHAFDADHIAAIDNVVRKLLHEGKPARLVGLFFSLGHSSVVVAVSILIVTAATVMRRDLEPARAMGGVIGTSVSAVFLIVIGVANLLVFKEIALAVIRGRRGERLAPEEFDSLLAGTGLIARMLRPLFRTVSHAWQMYPIGLLFGLGFDTATEIGVLGLTAVQAAHHLPSLAILVFPALFTAGMSLLDTADSLFMARAYGWALDNPTRKLRYNLAATCVSVLVALVVGGGEALAVLGGRLDADRPFHPLEAGVDDILAKLGYATVAFLVVLWILAGFRRRTPPAGSRPGIDARAEMLRRPLSRFRLKLRSADAVQAYP